MSRADHLVRSAWIQLMGLSLVFLVPWLSDRRWSLLAADTLAEILVFEFGVVTLGGLIISLFAVPAALTDSRTMRRVFVIASMIIALPLTRAYVNEYGWTGGVWFIWLLFITYGGAFTGKMKSDVRGRMLAEVGARWLFSFVFFALLAVILDTPTNVENWGSVPAGLAFGSIYFWVMGLLDARRSFARFTSFVYRLVQGR